MFSEFQTSSENTKEFAEGGVPAFQSYTKRMYIVRARIVRR